MVNTLLQTYQGKRVFLTGHTGFKGAWMVHWLTILGAEVKGYSLAPEYDNDLYHVTKVATVCDSIIADIRDKDRLEKEILDFQPDFIFHLAAQPLVRYSYEHPLETFETNVMGTGNVLNAVRKLRNKCSVVVITTDKVYENIEQDYAYKEEDHLGGYDPYSSSKACTEIITQSFRRSFFPLDTYGQHQKAIATARAGNVIGGGDLSNDRLIPDLVKAFFNKEEVIIRSPKSVRPWQHVLEAIGGYLFLGARLDQKPETFGEAWNFGPMKDDNLTVEELIKIAIESWGAGAYKIEEDKVLHEAKLLQLDISKLRNRLKWEPIYNSEKAIQLTVDWYKQTYQDNIDAKSLTILQIVNYQTNLKSLKND